jgi:hypothetical protein
LLTLLPLDIVERVTLFWPNTVCAMDCDHHGYWTAFFLFFYFVRNAQKKLRPEHVSRRAFVFPGVLFYMVVMTLNWCYSWLRILIQLQDNIESNLGAFARSLTLLWSDLIDNSAKIPRFLPTFWSTVCFYIFLKAPKIYLCPDKTPQLLGKISSRRQVIRKMSRSSDPNKLIDIATPHKRKKLFDDRLQ